MKTAIKKQASSLAGLHPTVAFLPGEHVVLRIKADDGVTIAEHQKIIQQSGHVLFAKIGKPLSSFFLDRLQQQIDQGMPTCMFVAIYEGKNSPFTILQSTINNIYIDLQPDKTVLVPPYLRSQIVNVKLWFDIGNFEKLHQSEIKRIHIITSGKELTSALRGMTSVFRVGVSGSKPFAVTPYISEVKQKVQFDDADYDVSLDDDSDYINNFFN